MGWAVRWCAPRARRRLGLLFIRGSRLMDCSLIRFTAQHRSAPAAGWAIQKGTRVRISLWDPLMFGRVPGTSPNISGSHSEIRTRVPFCAGACGAQEAGGGGHPTGQHLRGPPALLVSLLPDSLLVSLSPDSLLVSLLPVSLFVSPPPPHVSAPSESAPESSRLPPTQSLTRYGNRKRTSQPSRAAHVGTTPWSSLGLFLQLIFSLDTVLRTTAINTVSRLRRPACGSSWACQSRPSSSQRAWRTWQRHPPR